MLMKLAGLMIDYSSNLKTLSSYIILYICSSEIFEFFVHSVQRKIAQQVIFLLGWGTWRVEVRLLLGGVAEGIKIATAPPKKSNILNSLNICRPFLLLKCHRGHIFSRNVGSF